MKKLRNAFVFRFAVAMLVFCVILLIIVDLGTPEFYILLVSVGINLIIAILSGRKVKVDGDDGHDEK